MTCILAPRSLPAQDAPQKKTIAELQVDKAQQSKNARKVRDILRDPREPMNAENIDLLETFLRRYFFARMTREATFTELPQYREEIRERCGWTANKDSAAGEEMNRITSSLMHALCNGVLVAEGGAGTQQVFVLQGSIRDQNDRLRIVRSKQDLKSDDQIFNLAGDPVAQNTITELAPSTTDFHPAVKLNAMLVLGDLNDVQPRGRVEAKPRVNTQRDLIAYLESPEQLSDTLLVGALSGLQRHAHDALDPSRKARIAKVVANLVDAQAVSGRNAAAGLWIRRQAIDILGQLAVRKTGNFLLKVIEDGNEPVPLRIAAVDVVGQLKLDGLTPVSINRFAAGLAQLAADACKEELAAAMSPRSSFSPDRLRMRLAVVRLAVTGGGEQAEGGLMAVATEEEQKTLQELINVLQTVETQVQTLNAASNREQIEFVLGESVRVLSSLTPSDSDKKEKPTAPQTAEKS